MNSQVKILIIALVVAVAIPIAATVFWKKKTKEKLWPFIVGAFIWMFFVLGLENIVHQCFVYGDNEISKFLSNSALLFGIYGGLAAGIFEETGRLFAFKLLLHKHKEKECSIAYGIGHGGIEALLIIIPTYAVYLLFASGVMSNIDVATATSLGASLGTISAGTVCIALFERVVAMLLHIGLSILVFVAANEKKSFKWFFAAILLHTLTDIPAGLYHYGKVSVFAVEAWAVLMAAIVLAVGIRLYKNYDKKVIEEKSEKTNGIES